MKRLAAIFTVLFLLVVVGAYYGYEYFFAHKELTAWDVVPDKAVMVFEFSDCVDCRELAEHSPFSTLVRKVSFQQNTPDSLNAIAAFMMQYHTEGLVSVNITKTDNFDLAFYIPQTKGNNREEMDAAIAVWKTDKTVRFSDREFNGITIHEASSRGRIFSWAMLEDVWVGSFTSFLVEDAVRAYGDEMRRFRSVAGNAFHVSSVRNDAGNLYINVEKLLEWLSVFASDARITNMKLANAAMLDIKVANKAIVLNGFCTGVSRAGKSLLTAFEDQEPTSFTLKNLISNRTFFMVNYGFDNGASFFRNLNTLFPPPQDSVDASLRSFAVDMGEMYNAAGGNLSKAFVESRGHAYGTVGLLQTDDIQVWLNQFDKVSRASETGDTLFFEHYADYALREIELRHFTRRVFFPLFDGFEQTYYTSVGNTLIFCDDLEELKRFLDDIGNEDTWGRSVAMNRFLESTLLEANLSYYFNAQRAWNILLAKLASPWQRFVTVNRTLLDRFGPGAIQLSHLSDSYYTNIYWQYGEALETPRERVKTVTHFEAPLEGRVFMVRNFLDKDYDFLVQDSLHSLYLVSAEGEIRWHIPLEGQIRGDVGQVDYFKNGKLQYFFSTRQQLHIVDRLGRYVLPYPVTLHNADIQFSSVVDYDKSKRYRFLLADEDGQLWLLDKEGNLLEGWSPRKTGGPLFAAPQHHRIGAKDYMVAIRRDGYALVLNRRGELLKNFPLNLDARPAGDYALEAAKSVTASRIVIISREGFKIRFGFDGKIQSREPLIKTSIDAKFFLAPGTSTGAYSVLRQEPKELMVYDEQGKQWISNRFVGLSPVDATLYDLSAGRTLMSITDLQQGLIYLYDGKGTLLTPVPLNGTSSTVYSNTLTTADVMVLYENALTSTPIIH